jgi:sugar phosphate isomerase/epimerase
MYTRRALGKMALAALPAAHLLNHTPAFAQAKPNSKVRGVTIGMNVPYNFGGRSAPVDEILQNCVKLGVSGVELRTQPVEAYMGLPAALVTAAAPAGGRNAAPPPPDQQAARQKAVDDIRKWRASASMDKAREVRKKFEDAGVLIEIVKVDGIFDMPDDVLDYEFQLAKTLGARAISTEIAHVDPKQPDISTARHKRVGQFADKHRLMVGYHGHTETGPKEWEDLFKLARYNGANLDIGHFLAGNKTSPVPFLKQHHDRITHVHIKDKTMNNVNVPFGRGETPIKEVLQVIRDNRWPIQATIEFEYPIPAGSDRMAELQKCVDYCRAALNG